MKLKNKIKMAKINVTKEKIPNNSATAMMLKELNESEEDEEISDKG